MVGRRQINQVAKRIAEEFRPERIILFGSYAYGAPTEDSDVDLLVVKRMRGDVIKMAGDIYGFVHRISRSAFSVDVLVRTPAEMERRIAMNDFFLREIAEKGKVVYEVHQSCLTGVEHCFYENPRSVETSSRSTAGSFLGFAFTPPDHSRDSRD